MTDGVAPSSGRESENLVNSPNLLSTSIVPPYRGSGSSGRP